MRIRFLCVLLVGVAGCERIGAERAADAPKKPPGPQAALVESAGASRLAAPSAASLAAQKLNAAEGMPAMANVDSGAPAVALKLEDAGMPATSVAVQHAAQQLPAVASAAYAAPAMAVKLELPVMSVVAAPVRPAMQLSSPEAASVQAPGLAAPESVAPSAP